MDNGNDQNTDIHKEEKAHENAPSEYVVLARKYRPTSFDDLIGQDAMVRTLTNAFKAGRLAQGFMLTGVRGTGKTTTARILARALNYASEDGSAGPTVNFKEEGLYCRAIMESRHMDVIEMDAASHTGINDIREIIESIQYKPAYSRYKIYIIDEVHMLSTQAFNGLLKTLEEPPAHVKFIFATTEIRKVPVTILSRCQRFDLKRVKIEELQDFLKAIAEKEGAQIDDQALALIARASEGSVRDSLSILDQAIANKDEMVTAQSMRELLGLADHSRLLDLFDQMTTGQIAQALENLQELYLAGADPIAILNDLAELTHQVTREKAVPDSLDKSLFSPEQIERIKNFANVLSMASLSRLWQMLLKGLDDVKSAAMPIQATEMLLIRLAYVSQLPTPENVIKILQSDHSGIANQTTPSPNSDSGPAVTHSNQAPSQSAPLPDATMSNPDTPSADTQSHDSPRMQSSAPVLSSGSGASPARLVSVNPEHEHDIVSKPENVEPQAKPETVIERFEDILELVDKHRDSLLKYELTHCVKLISLKPRALDLAFTTDANTRIISQLGDKLQSWTGEKWIIGVQQDSDRTRDLLTHDQLLGKKHATLIQDAQDDPLVGKVLATFKDAHIKHVDDLSDLTKSGEPSTPLLDEDHEGN